jgi:rhodanese-related sulfurtransferase
MKSTLLSAILLSLATMTLSADDAKPATTAADTKADDVKHVDAAGAKKVLDEAAAKKDAKVKVLDVRTADEFAEGHIAGAVNVDFLSKDFAEKAAALDKSATYVVHCQAGGRSMKSLETLKKLGIKSIIHMDGGFGAWQKAGLPVEKAK